MEDIMSEQLDAAEFLIENGANLDIIDEEDGDNILCLCARFGNLRLFDILIVNGAIEINYRNLDGATPLILAIMYGNMILRRD